MKRVLFICHGNICRSVMGEYILQQMVNEAGREAEFVIDSAAVSREEIGNDMYPPAKRTLAAHGVPFGHHAARQMTRRDYEQNDYIICMDRSNIRLMNYIIGEDTETKVTMMMLWAGQERDVADPWYTGDFEKTYEDLVEGCRGFLEKVTGE